MIWLTVALAGVVILIVYIGLTLAAVATRPPPAELQQPSEDEVGEFLAGLPPWEQKHERPAPGKTIYTDHSVVLPYTRQLWQPPTPAYIAQVPIEQEERPAAFFDEHDLAAIAAAKMPAVSERLASDTDVRTVTSATPDVESVLPAWVIKALNGHDSPDACLDSIVARAASDA